MKFENQRVTENIGPGAKPVPCLAATIQPSRPLCLPSPAVRGPAPAKDRRLRAVVGAAAVKAARRRHYPATFAVQPPLPLVWPCLKLRISSEYNPKP